MMTAAMAKVTMGDNEDRRRGDAPNTGVVVKARPKTKKPTMYKVLMLNDDYTPMEFVVHVLGPPTAPATPSRRPGSSAWGSAPRSMCNPPAGTR